MSDASARTGGEGRPVHSRPRSIALVFLGGAAGTAARAGITVVAATDAGIPFPLATSGINVLGAFLLGMLLEALVRRGPDDGRRRDIRLLLGTGFLGGFTTYSALATDTSLLLGSGDTAIALLYSVGTLVLGAAATLAGIVVAVSVSRMRGDSGSESGEGG